MPILLDAAYLLAALVFAPILLWERFARGKKRGGWGQRLGGVPARSGDRPCVWVHAVSLGEVNATRGLVAEIQRRLPDYDVVISVTTDTGWTAARELYGAQCVFRYPLDFSLAVRRLLDRIRPAAIVLMELEVWPNFIELASRRDIPIVIANGRVTREKSMRRFSLPIVRSLARRMFSRVALVAAQDETYAARFRELGVPDDRVRVAGNMKYDTALIAESIPGDAELAAALGIDRCRPLVACGSTGPGEEELLLDCWQRLRRSLPALQFAIIPRKPERFDEVARLIESKGLACLRRSQCPDGPTSSPPAGPAVFLGDTMGELRKFYALADVVFVGRSLVPLGGSDVMEVAGLARPMCFGPHMENFADAVEKLLAARAAAQVRTTNDLTETWAKLLADKAEAMDMARRARDVVRANVGATARTVRMLREAMGMAE